MQTQIKSTCCYCGVGCGVLIETDGTQVTGVRGDPDHPANFGRLCSKGSTLHLSMQPQLREQVRVLQPELRTQRDLPRKAVSWDNAFDVVAQKMAETIAQHGPDSVAFYVSGQLLTEDYYVFNKLAKGLIGTNNIDSNSRLCMSSAVAGYKMTLGADAPPACYEDIDHAELIFIAGSNTAFAHPVLYRRIEEARARNPALKVIVVDPRCTDTAREADLFLPILPGTDVALFNGMLHICLWEDLLDTNYIAHHTEGFAVLKQTLRDYPPSSVAKTCGIKEEDLVTAARWFAQSKASLSLYCQGLNQSSSGSTKNAALINLHLATGQIGKLGAGPFSLTGQPNAMGGREVGGMANLMSGHRDLANPVHRAEVAALWGIESVPEKPGKTAVELFEALASGDIKIIWIVCTNPAQSMPDQHLVRAALHQAELVIVQEAYHTSATVPFADVLLPASSWAEKVGTVTNSERRISRINAAIAAPGSAKHDWQIATEFAQKLAILLGKPAPSFEYTEPEQIWNEHRDTTIGRDLDIGGLSYQILAQQGPQQWPFPRGAQTGKQRLYADGVFPTESGRARFANAQYQAVAEKLNARHPFALNTGRLRDQWHGMTRTGSIAQLFSHVPEPAVYMARSDMERRFFKDNDLLRLSNARGEQVLAVKMSDEVRPGQVFVPMHWGEEYLSGRDAKGHHLAGINSLTSPTFDPVSKQPELKHAAVQIVKAELPWRMVVFGWFEPTQVWRMQQTLRSIFNEFSYVSLVPFGREKTGLSLRLAHTEAVSTALIKQIEQWFSLDGAEVLRYDDPRRGNARRIVVKNGVLQTVMLVGDISAEHWLKDYLQVQSSVQALGRSLLMPGQSAPAGTVARGRIVCNCFNVSETEITAQLSGLIGSDQERLRQLQNQLRCGTQCGSCVPELKKIIAMTPATIASQTEQA